MAVARKDDRHNADLVAEIADSFTRALDRKTEATDAPVSTDRPRFVITGDNRASGTKRPGRTAKDRQSD